MFSLNSLCLLFLSFNLFSLLQIFQYCVISNTTALAFIVGLRLLVVFGPGRGKARISDSTSPPDNLVFLNQLRLYFLLTAHQRPMKGMTLWCYANFGGMINFKPCCKAWIVQIIPLFITLI